MVNDIQHSGTALILDTETDQGHDPRPIQIATIDMLTGKEWVKYFNSGRPISPFTTQIHGITDADVKGLEAFDLSRFTVPDYLIAHNARFDWRVIGSPEVKLICTVQLARLAFPEWNSYKQGRCIEQLFASQGAIGQKKALALTAHAHDALGDVRMCYLIYKACCERLGVAESDFAKMHELSQTATKANFTKRPRPKAGSQKSTSASLELAIMPFGKYKGMPIKAIPKSYAKWLLANATNLEAGLILALKTSVGD